MMTPARSPQPFESAAAIVLATALGVGFALWLFGWMLVDPGAVAWLMHGDRAQNFLGWHLYRNEPGSLPLGRISALLAPVGGSLAYTDAIPWLAILLKPLAPVLPPTFQFAGIWIAACYGLQGLFGFLLLRRVLIDGWIALAATPLLVMSPVLLHRRGHVSLCAQWLILAAFLAHASTRNVSTGAFLLRWLPLLVLACGTHPYLAVMVCALAAAACIDGAPGRRGVAALRLALVPAVAASSAWFFGYFGTPSPTEHGFGTYSADLLALVNPVQWSRVLPGLAISEGEYEGFAYLGSGTLALIVVLPLAWLRRQATGAGARDRVIAPRPFPWALAAVVVGLAGFSLGSRMRIAAVEFVDLAGPYRFFEPVPSIFRASGRFLWPLHYASIVAVVAAIRGAIPSRRTVALVLLGAAGLQLADSWHVYSAQRVVWMAALNREWNPLRSDLWKDVGRDYAEIRIVPPDIHDAVCLPTTYKPYFYVPFAYLAGLQRMRINSGHLSRQPRTEIAAMCAAFASEIDSGATSPDALYVVSDDYLGRFTAARAGIATCGPIDGFTVCVRADRPTPLRDRLSRAVLPTGGREA